MVICKYFQTGNCRFGSKCVNEHFDIKQYIKTEVEAALKGSQWPLSCFGIFKEKPCIPNFIEDQSYEEVRYLCYKARKENCFPAFEQQFMHQVLDAQNKMKTLLTLSREVVEAVIKLYDDAEIAQKGGQQQQTSNPFSLGGNSLAQQSAPGLFGNTPAQSNPFASPASNFNGRGVSAGNIFGGGQSTATTGSIIGQSAFASSGYGTNQSAAFAGQQPNTFSLNQLGQQAVVQPQGGNIFSMGSQQSAQVAPNSVFGPNVQQQQQVQQQTPFATGNAFPAQTNIFAQPTQQQQSVAGGNLFTQQPQQQQPNQQPTGFASFAQPQTAPSFATQPAGIFAQQQQHPQQQFQMQQQPQQQQQQQLQQQSGQNIFINPQQAAFSQQQAQSNNPNVFANPQANAFSTNQQQAVGAPMFAVTNQPQQGQQQSNAFAQVPQNQFPQAPQAAQQPAAITNDTAYSKMEWLSPEEIEAFKADQFVLGNIPTNPPPRELVI